MTPTEKIARLDQLLKTGSDICHRFLKPMDDAKKKALADAILDELQAAESGVQLDKQMMTVLHPSYIVARNYLASVGLVYCDILLLEAANEKGDE